MKFALGLVLFVMIGVAVHILGIALTLLLLTVITGIIYAVDALIWSKRRDKRYKIPQLIEYARSFFPLFLMVLLVRSFVLEPFRIPSGSLEPTLLVGDFLVVNKFIYGLRLPVWDKKVLSISSPKTGDIVVFRWPPNPKLDFIKRVIGVPGDVVKYHHKVLTINGKIAPQAFVQYTIDESSGNPVAQYRENLNGVTHDIYRRSDVPGIDFEITVPANSYFVMGDNRDDSADSRYWGFVHDDYLRGKATLTWLSWDSKQWTIRWKRLGSLIH